MGQLLHQGLGGDDPGALSPFSEDLDHPAVLGANEVVHPKASSLLPAQEGTVQQLEDPACAVIMLPIPYRLARQLFDGLLYGLPLEIAQGLSNIVLVALHAGMRLEEGIEQTVRPAILAGLVSEELEELPQDRDRERHRCRTQPALEKRPGQPGCLHDRLGDGLGIRELRKVGIDRPCVDARETMKTHTSIGLQPDPKPHDLLLV